MEKRKREHPFDIEYSDNYQLEDGATSDINNSHYFFAFSFNSKECMYFRSAKRGGAALDEVWMVYRDEAGNVYRSVKDHFSKNEKNPTSVNCIEAGKKMEFIFDGLVRLCKLTDRGYVVDEEVEAIPLKLTSFFEGTTDVFEFTHHMDSNVTASAISKEKFNKEFQNAFNAIYQVHYEQGGKVNFTVTLNNEKRAVKDFHSIRDHSYGKRNWDFFDRYIWNIIILENGDFIHSSMMRYPVLRELQAGFKINTQMTSLKQSTPMDNIPIVGTTPGEYSIDVVFSDDSKAKVDVCLDFVCPFYFEKDFNVNEGVCDFVVDGLKGKGIGEFGYNKNKDRWVRK